MHWAVLDTSVYIDHWERGLWEEELTSLLQTHVVRHSSVVLSELVRGARTKEAHGQVRALRDAVTVEWAPLSADWWEAGELVKLIGDRKAWELGKRREFQNDALIALTVRRHGAHLVTTNGKDFELLSERVRFTFTALPGR